MKTLTTTAASALAWLALCAAGAALAQAPAQQSISPGAARATVDGPAQFFTGRVRVTPLFDARQQSPLAGAWVAFDAGARSAWHMHPYGQRLVVTAGAGRTQVWGGPVSELKPGDVVWCPPGVKHWHGAAPAQAMTHMALTGTVDGKNVTWMEQVSDAQYNTAPSAAPAASL